MKELTIEEKAKAYDKALEKAQELYNNPNSSNVGKAYIYAVLPELKENSNKRIRKALIDYFRWNTNGQLLNEFTNREVFAWLEKQYEKCEQKSTNQFTSEQASILDEHIDKFLEQKPADKVEPRFHKDEWITNGDYTWKIVEVRPLDYILQSQEGNIVDDTISHVDEQFHSFTIQDAKVGDILFYKVNLEYSNGIKFDRICLFNTLDNAFFTVSKYSNSTEDYGINENIDYPDNIMPATKEQKEILFMTIKEAGYKWDTNKLELKKINMQELVKQNSAWNEEDEKMFECALNMIEWYSGVDEDKSRPVSD